MKIERRPLKAYWFIPDGLRADDNEFNVFKWAKEGKLPNIKILMENGSYGLSEPFFPSHTPTNFATLLTGTTPDKHKVTDGPIRLQGYPLKYVTKPGFRSSSKNVPSIWHILQKENLFSTLISVPGSTPPDFDYGQVIRGRWGGWGIDLPAVVFTNKGQFKKKNRLFYEGTELTKYGETKESTDGFTTKFVKWDHEIMFHIISKGDKPSLKFKIEENEYQLNVMEWSDWIPVTIKKPLKGIDFENTPKVSKVESDLSKVTLKTRMKIIPITLNRRGDYRIRILYDLLNEYAVRPFSLANELKKNIPGGMVDFSDNYPPQLILEENDKKVFLDEMNMSFDWHNKAAEYLIKQGESNFIVHNIYSPNQMLTSRWWMKYMDPRSSSFEQATKSDKEIAKEEVLNMYKRVDEIIGTILNNKNEESLIVLSSDHGVVPLNYNVHLNNLFKKKGWLKLDKNGEIDWPRTKVIFLKTAHVYIHPEGLGGNYTRSSSPDYFKLRDEVILLLSQIKTSKGASPISKLLKYEKVKSLHLAESQVGDLVLSNTVGFGFTEILTPNSDVIITNSKRSGYKQALLPKTAGLTTPFIISGKNIKKDYRIKKNIDNSTQLGIILKSLNINIPSSVTSEILFDIFEK